MADCVGDLEVAEWHSARRRVVQPCDSRAPKLPLRISWEKALTLSFQSDEADRLRVAATWNQRLDIQGLRAVAVLMVLAFHAALPVPGGYIGVNVFFVMSGIAITGMLMRELNSRDGIR